MALLSYIYVLREPDTFEIRYCGQTRLGIRDRLRFHVANTIGKSINKNSCSTWVDSLLERGLVPIIECLEECSRDKAHERERYWIAKLRGECPGLLNLAHGGAGLGGLKRSREWCKVSSDRMKALWLTQEFRDKMIAGRHVMWSKPGYRERRIEEGLRRRGKLSPDKAARYREPTYREAQRVGGLAAWSDPDRKAVRLAHAFSPTAREARGVALAKRWQDPEQRPLLLASVAKGRAARAANRKKAAFDAGNSERSGR